MMRIHERQWVIRNPILWPILAILLVVNILNFRQAMEEIPGLFLLMVLPMALIAFLHLDVKLGDSSLRVMYMPLWRRSIPLDQIVSARAITVNPIRQLGGYGIRFGLGGIAYNVRGRQLIRLELAKHRDLMIGTQYPDEWIDALERSGITIVADE